MLQLSVILLLMVTATSFSLASPALNITVFTDKPSYVVEESITVYGNLTYGGVPLQEWLIALEIQDSYGTTVVTRTLQTDKNGTYSITFKLPSNSKLGTYMVYVSANYKGEIGTNSATFKLIQIVQVTVTIESKDYTVTIESNATITNVTTEGMLTFTSLGPTGRIAYVNITSPIGLNKTEIKVFIDDVELIPPPFPIITSNSTHYFIYFEFALSIHTITIKYAIADIAATNVTPGKTAVGQGYAVRIDATIQNQGHYEETFNVTVYANTTAVAAQTIILAGGDSTIVTFTWSTIGFVKGNYTISAIADTILGETDTADNNWTDGAVLVTILGDVDGDRKVDAKDIASCIKAYATYPSHSRWDPNVDVNCDNRVDGKDIALTIKNYGKWW